MNAGTQQILQEAEPAPERNVSNDDLRTNKAAREIAARVNGSAVVDRKPRVFVAADKRLLREAISRMLVKSGEIEIAGPDFVEPFRAEDLLRVLSSRGNANGDLAAVRMARTTAPRVQILLIGDGRRVRVSAVRAGGSEREFAARRFGKRRVGRSASTASWRSSLPGRTLRNLVPVFGETSNFLSFRDRTPEDGIDAARTAIDATDCRRAHEQGNCEPLLPLGTDSEKPSLPDAAQNRARRIAWASCRFAIRKDSCRSFQFAVSSFPP